MHCDTKRAYRTAQQAANAAAGRSRDGVKYLRVYECPECGAFHLTSEEPKPSHAKHSTGWGYKPDRRL